jgi:hypothetical protein
LVTYGTRERINLAAKNELYAAMSGEVKIILETSKDFYSPSTIVERFLLSPTVQKHLIAKKNLTFLSIAQQPLVGQDLLRFEASKSHSHTIFGKTPLDERSARRRDHHLTTYDTD